MVTYTYIISCDLDYITTPITAPKEALFQIFTFGSFQLPTLNFMFYDQIDTNYVLNYVSQTLF